MQIIWRRALNEFKWKRYLKTLNVNKQVTVINRTVFNVLKSNLCYAIPLNYIFDDKYPLWFKKKIIQKDISSTKTFHKNGLIDCLRDHSNRLALINTAKQNYYSRLTKELLSV